LNAARRAVAAIQSIMDRVAMTTLQTALQVLLT
jgi:hypothetical protein